MQSYLTGKKRPAGMFATNRMKNSISLKNLLKLGLHTTCQEKKEVSC